MICDSISNKTIILFLTILIVMIFLPFPIMDANATVCGGHPTSNIYRDTMRLGSSSNIYFIITISSTEKIKLSEPIQHFDGITYYSNRAYFTINEIINNEELKFDGGYIVAENLKKDFVKINHQYLATVDKYSHDNAKKLILGFGNCNSSIGNVDIVEWYTFLQKISEIQCDHDKSYLAKYSNHDIVCVNPQTQTKLIERGYGYFVPDLSYDYWQEIFTTHPTEIGSVGHSCDEQTTLKTIEDKRYCIPVWLFMHFDSNIVVTNLSQTIKSPKTLQTNVANDVLIEFQSNKYDYMFPEPVVITGQFNKYVGKFFSFEGRYIPINKDNSFNFAINYERLESSDSDKINSSNKYLVIKDKRYGIFTTNFNYNIDDEMKNFIFWKNIVKGHPEIFVQHYLTKHAMFTSEETARFFELYPRIASDYPSPIIYETKPVLGLSEEDIEELLPWIAEIDNYDMMLTTIPAESYGELFELKHFSKEQAKISLKNANFPKIYVDKVIDIAFS